MIKSCERCGKQFCTEDTAQFEGDAKICYQKQIRQYHVGMALYPLPANFNNNMEENTTGNLQYEPYVLCDACLREFHEWLYKYGQMNA